MASAAQHSSAPGTAFVTVSTHNRLPVFSISRVAELFIETLLHYRAHGLIKLHAYVVMPDQVYLLLTPIAASTERTIAVIQNGFAQRLKSPGPVWKPGFEGLPVRTMRGVNKLRTQLHELPVRAHLTATPELYPYSSAHRLASIAPQLTAKNRVLTPEQF